MYETEKNETARNKEPALGQELSPSIATIVAAFATREAATVDEIVELARRLSGMLPAGNATDNALNQERPEEVLRENTENPPTPAVSLDNAVTEDHVFCLCCGRGFTMLKRHLKAEHNLTEDQYRTKFDLPDDFPLVAPSYSARKAAYAKQVGLGKYRRELPSVSAN